MMKFEEFFRHLPLKKGSRKKEKPSQVPGFRGKHSEEIIEKN